MENNATEALLQDEVDKEIQDTLQTTIQEEPFSEGKAVNDQNTDKNVATEDKECKGDSPTEKDTDMEESPKDITPVVNADRGDGPQEKLKAEMHCDANPKKIEDDIPDGAPDPLNEESEDKSAVTSESTTETPAQDDEENSDSVTENQESLSKEAPIAEETVSKKDVETIGPAHHVESRPISDVPPTFEENKRRKFWIAVAIVALVAVLLQVLQLKDPPQKTDLRQIDIFHQEMEKLMVQFPSQREELWKRSRIHLQRHFQITQPTEPVSVILTAGVRAEGTLRCLAQSIASALSSALNASALHLDGASKSSQDSDLVKSDIDSQLQKAFEGGKPIAVIHRFEELPPASTLIFYRYCDHENAAFKKTFLIFTVLLEEEEEIQAKIRLSEVEEMVTDHLQKKFLSHGHPTGFDKMDIDKYGGLWSRISHLILPVATETRIETTQQC